MLTYPTIDPVIFALGPLQVRWYGLMYVLGFLAAYQLVSLQARQFSCEHLRQRLDNLNLALIIGVVLGGRLGYVLFYNPAYYLAHPLEIPATWSGGMSFHGGCLGALVAGLLYCRRAGLDFWQTADLYVVTAPVGLFFGRVGNFINGELYGRATTVPWAWSFPTAAPCPAIPPSSTRPGSRGSCSSSFSGRSGACPGPGQPPADGRTGPCSPCFSASTACSALSWSSSANPTANSACSSCTSPWASCSAW